MPTAKKVGVPDDFIIPTLRPPGRESGVSSRWRRFLQLARQQQGITIIETAALLVLAFLIICILLIFVSEQVHLPGSNKMRM